MGYALVENNVVINTISLSHANAHEFPNAVNYDGYAVQIGDNYIDGKFYRDDVEILSDHQIELQKLEAKISTIDEQYINLMYDYTLLELGLMESE